MSYPGSLSVSPSGLRFGTAAATSRGFNEVDFKQVGDMIGDMLDSLLLNDDEKKQVFQTTRNRILEMCNKYPIYEEAF